MMMNVWWALPILMVGGTFGAAVMAVMQINSEERIYDEQRAGCADPVCWVRASDRGRIRLVRRGE
jgi:hypothetical protein